MTYNHFKLMSYKDLKSYQMATIVYDFTVEFCHLYIDPKSRTNDQMVQAARSGKQNIVEGSANKTSEKSELKLLGVARVSFAELLEDFEDFLRQRGLKQWDKNDPKAREIRGLVYKYNKSDRSDKSDMLNKYDQSYSSYESYLSNPENAANTAICLINQAGFLLDQQIRSAEKQFATYGDYSDKLKINRKNQILAQQQEADRWLKEVREKLEQSDD